MEYVWLAAGGILIALIIWVYYRGRKSAHTEAALEIEEQSGKAEREQAERDREAAEEVRKASDDARLARRRNGGLLGLLRPKPPSPSPESPSEGGAGDSSANGS